jgi:competence protein ComEA
VVVVIVALAVTVGIGVLRAASTPAETVPVEVDDSHLRGAPAQLYVHVAGAVAAPGLYVLEPGSRVVDAVAAAGGFSDDAEPASVNLARPVDDGEQIVVPTVGATVSGAGALIDDGRVDLNTADVSQLDTLPRIGAAMAQRIVDWREANGRFTSVEDLLAVAGIGEKMLEALRDLVTV